MFAQDTLTENNYRLFFGLALDVLIRPWEKLVLGQKYNEVLFIGRGAPRPFTISADLFIHRFFLPSSLLSLRSSAPSVSIAIYERSRRIFLRKPPLATCVTSSCGSSRSARFSTSIMCVHFFQLFFCRV
jgi:hypothetical protein